MSDMQMKLITLGIVALATIIFVYAPWRPKKKCPSCGCKVGEGMKSCPRCNSAII